MADTLTAHDVPVGAIFVHSWGYDQTNTDFYEVIARTAKSVKIRRIAKTSEYLGSGQDSVVPKPGSNPEGEVLTKFVKYWDWNGRKAVLRINDYTACAQLWDGTPERETAAGWGH